MFTSKLVVGTVLVGTLLASRGWATAQTNAKEHCDGCDVAFSFTTSSDGSQLRATGAGGVVVQKRLNREGLRIDISTSGDAVEIIARVDGTISMSRGEQSVVVRPESVLAEYDAKVQQLVAGSAAVDGLERMVLALRNNNKPEAMSVMASFALLRSLQGDETGNALLATRSAQRRNQGGLRLAQHQRGDDTTVNDCWDEYERTVDRNYQRYSQCLRDYWWAQPVQYACGLEWAMVAELALFRLISCSGGFPIG